MDTYPENLPLAPTAILSPRVFPHIGIASEDEIKFVFPNKTPVVDIERIARRYPGSTLYVVDTRISFEILGTNRYYDHSPLNSRVTL